MTFFSSFGSGTSTVWLEEGEPAVSKKDVSFSSPSSTGSATIGGFRWLLSDSWMISPRLNLGRGCDCGTLGEISCCRICFFSSVFFREGVELLRFFRGDGEPGLGCGIVGGKRMDGLINLSR